MTFDVHILLLEQHDWSDPVQWMNAVACIKLIGSMERWSVPHRSHGMTVMPLMGAGGRSSGGLQDICGRGETADACRCCGRRCPAVCRAAAEPGKRTNVAAIEGFLGT